MAPMLVGCQCTNGTTDFTFARAVHTVAAGAVNCAALITARVPLPDIDTAIGLVRRGDGIKPQLLPGAAHGQPGSRRA